MKYLFLLSILFLSIIFLLGCIQNQNSAFDPNKNNNSPSPSNSDLLKKNLTSLNDNTPSDNNAPDNNHNNFDQNNENQPALHNDQNQPDNPPQDNNGFVMWDFFDTWTPKSIPPACKEPLLFNSPVDLNLATSILYPGQIRGGDFKPHGGFRFDNSSYDDINVTIPLNGYVLDGARYYEGGEIQYLFDFVDPCGIMQRFDHLRILSPKFDSLVKTLPEPMEGDTRTTPIRNIFVSYGELLAIGVGFKNNVGMDWGVYDLRKKNLASSDPAWLSSHPGQQAPYALCWLDLLPENEKQKAKALPGGDYLSKKQSDYCN